MNRTRIAYSPAAMALACLLMWAPSAQAETIRGTVTGAGRSLVGASVRLLELSRAERTGAGGEFSFSGVAKGKYRLVVSLVGFAPVTSAVDLSGDSASATIDLKESAFPLKEVVISASAIPQTPDNLYQSAETKTQVDFLSSSGMSFTDKISDLGGVNVRGNGSAPNRPVLRGLSDNRVLILENGLRTGDIATYDPAHATPVEAIGISEVEVVRGPATILSGPSSIGGVVNVVTDVIPSVGGRPISGTLALEGNSANDGYAGYFNTLYSGVNSALRVSAGGTHANNIRIPTGVYTDPASGKEFALERMPQSFNHSAEFGLGYAYQGDFGNIGVGAKHYEMNYGIPGVPPNADWEEVPPATSRIAQRRNTFEFSALTAPGAGRVKQWKLTANYNDYNHSEYPTAQDETGVSDPQANHFHKKAFNGTLQMQHQHGEQCQGTVGLWANIEDLSIDGDQPLGPNSVTTGLAGYLFEEYLPAENTRVQGGLRFDYNKIQTNPFAESTDPVFQTLNESRTTNAMTASFGLIQKFTPEVTGTFSVARSFRAPTVQELFANGLDAPSGTYTVGTDSLGPESGIGIDASLKGTFDNVTFEVSPYANFIKHYIYGFLRGDTLEDFPVRQFTSTDARLMGFEASVTFQPAKNLAIRAGSDYVNAQDTQADVPLPFTPPLRGLLRATYQDEQYMGMAELRLAATQDRLGDGDTPTAGYGVVNVGVGARIVSGGVSHNISIHCDNVFNKVYRDHLSVIKDFLPQPARGLRLNYELLY